MRGMSRDEFRAALLLQHLDPSLKNSMRQRVLDMLGVTAMSYATLANRLRAQAGTAAGERLFDALHEMVNDGTLVIVHGQQYRGRIPVMFKAEPTS